MPARPLLPLLLLLANPAALAAAPDLGWPQDELEPRPVLQREWPDEAPGEERIAAEFASFADFGFGTVEVAPSPTVDVELWPAPSWTVAIDAASRLAGENGLQLDLRCHPGSAPAPGGFPALTLEPIQFRHLGGLLEWDAEGNLPLCLAAWPGHGEPVDLLPEVNPENGLLSWDAPPGPWQIYGLRSVVAGEALDPFSPEATAYWLGDLAQRTLSDQPREVRAYTRPVADVPGANWSPSFLAAFERQRGYRLPDQLPALFGDIDAGTGDRVLCDFRQTLAELHVDNLAAWHELCRQTSSLSRATFAAGSGHPVDLASVVDLPGMSAPSPYATSAAHLGTKPLVHAELGAIGDSPPAELRSKIHESWLAGANQSSLRIPAEEAVPSAGLAALGGYLARVQSVLQQGAPDPDLLLYYPAHDFWSERGGIPGSQPERSEWLEGTGFHRCARDFHRAGIGFDVVSDRLLERASVVDDRILLGGLSYRCLILPDVRRLPETTALLLLELARRGGRIGVLGRWPDDVPGFPQPDIRRGTMFQALMNIPDSRSHSADDPLPLAAAFGVEPEAMTRHGLRCIRRSHALGHHYLVVNPGREPVDAWFGLARPAAALAVLDPKLPRLRGLADSRASGEAEDAPPEFHLRIGPGEARILRSFHEDPGEEARWPEIGGTPVSIAGPWTLRSVGDDEAEPLTAPFPGSWRSLGRPDLHAGPIAYHAAFPHPGEGDWLLDLGSVAGCARVSVNGKSAGESLLPPHHLSIDHLLKSGDNELVVEIHQSGEADLAGLLGPVRLVPLTRMP